MIGPRPTLMRAADLRSSSALTVRLRGRTPHLHNHEPIRRRHASLLLRGRTRLLAVLPRRVLLQAAVRTIVVADRTAEETAAATRVVHRTGAADFAIANSKVPYEPAELQQAYFFSVQMEMPYNSWPLAGLVFADAHTRQVNPIWKLKQSPDVAVPESGAMV
jgi:hypothetical protein